MVEVYARASIRLGCELAAAGGGSESVTGFGKADSGRMPSTLARSRSRGQRSLRPCNRQSILRAVWVFVSCLERAGTRIWSMLRPTGSRRSQVSVTKSPSVRRNWQFRLTLKTRSHAVAGSGAAGLRSVASSSHVALDSSELGESTQTDQRWATSIEGAGGWVFDIPAWMVGP